MKPREIFLRALERKSVPRPATGSATSVVTIDLMGKTGIYFPGAHLDAEKMAGLAETSYTEIGFDNIMPLFSVCLESAALGCTVDWGAVNVMPACKGSLYGIEEAVTIPKDLLNRIECKASLESIGILKKRYGDEAAIMGKVFGPWTLGYHVFGIEEFLINTLLKPDAVKRAINTLKEVSIIFGTAQLEAGADALCFGDHATRDVCSPDAYRNFLQDIHHEIKERLNCPMALHICGDTSDRISYIKETRIDCFHFDSKVSSKDARELAGDTLSLMGGTDNIEVIRNGKEETIVQDVQEKKANKIDIIGPECAVPLDAPSENMKVLADEVKKCNRR